MKDFNLMVSTSRFNEKNASAELWFILFMCGDEYPIISRNIHFPGVIMASTIVNEFEIIKKVKQIVKEDPKFFQFLLKIIPINYSCETNTQIIQEIIESHYKEFIHESDTFKIQLMRRKNKLINRDDFIVKIARNINNKVNLDSPDKAIRIEILGNVCGISFLKPEDIFKTSVANFFEQN